MKRYICYVVIASGFLVSFTGCKKQNIQEEIIITDTTSIPTPVADPAINSKGILTGKIEPESKYSLILYNDRYSYENFSIMNRTGAFLMTNIEAGTYNLVIQPYDETILPMEVTKISIDSGRTTNLGLIFLP